MGELRRLETVGLEVALHKRRAAERARDLVDALQARGMDVRVNARIGSEIGGKVALVSESELVRADLVIVLGGDGSFLRCARLAAPVGTPLLGVYMGGFGFLTETNAELLHSQLDAIAAGQFEVEERMMLDASFDQHGAMPAAADPSPTTCLALNDIVVHRGAVGGLLECRVAVDGQEVGEYRGDGLVVATPTGSTAYSLAAGGPVVQPDLECLIITPMCLHTLNIRPLVVNPGRSIRIELAPDGLPRGASATVTADGQAVGDLCDGSSLTVTRSKYKARLVKLGEGTFIDRLRQKLRWGAEI